MALTFDTITVGILGVNCYVVSQQESGAALIVDPGDDADEILRVVEERALRPEAILLTHGHVDHIRGTGQVATNLDLPVFIHPDDQRLYSSPDNTLLPWFPAVGDLPEPSPWPPAFSAAELTIMHTPGHTPGGVCYYFATEGVVLSGDTLFRGGIGRTDFVGGSMPDLLRSIRRELFVLPPETRVLPGHQEATTIREEQATNPFVT